MKTNKLIFVLMMVVAVASAQTVTVPPNTTITARINENVTSEKAKAGDPVSGVLTEPIVANGQTLFPRGSDVRGSVVKAAPSGRLSSSGVLEIIFSTVQSGNRMAYLDVMPWRLEGASHTKSNVAKIGGGAAAGAIIGAIAGGGKGAAIGAGVGAAAGTGVAVATGKKEAVVESESILQLRTVAPNTTGAYYGRQVAGRDSRYGTGSSSNEYPNGSNARGARNNRGNYSIFSSNDRQAINDCFNSGTSGLPPGLAKKDRLPPGLERQVRRNGKLPPGLQKRVSALPSQCQANLPSLPANWQRVVLGDRVMVLDPVKTITDIFRVSTNR